jgi:hypothetical protein
MGMILRLRLLLLDLEEHQSGVWAVVWAILEATVYDRISIAAGLDLDGLCVLLRTI